MLHDGQLQAIDFDDCGYGWHYYDLAVAFKEFTDHPGSDHLRQSLFEGYETCRTLPDMDHRLDLFLAVRDLVTIGWMDGRPELASDEFMRERVEFLLARVQAYLA